MQEVCESLSAVHTGSHIFGSKAPHVDRYDVPKDVDMEAADKETCTRSCARIPTPTQVLFVQKTYIRRFDGMTNRKQAAAGFLIDHATQPRFQCRVRWHDVKC